MSYYVEIMENNTQDPPTNTPPTSTPSPSPTQNINQTNTPINSNQPSTVNSDIPNWLAPVNRTGMAIAAGYLGMFAFLIIPAPIALIVGILALIGLKKHPEKVGKGRAWFGTIAGIFGTFILLVIIVGVFTHKK